MSKANKTQTTLDTLTTQLKETGILVDNVTNTSLALANTQFIESRVQEDDVEIKNIEKEQEVIICLNLCCFSSRICSLPKKYLKKIMLIYFFYLLFFFYLYYHNL